MKIENITIGEDIDARRKRMGYRIERIPDDYAHYNFVRRCLYCQFDTTVKVTRQGLWNWEHGQPVQAAFPDMGMEDREVLVSNIDWACYEAAGGSDERWRNYLSRLIEARKKEGK